MDIGQQISWVYTEDLARAHAFYGELLGFERVLDEGDAWIYRSSGTGFIGVCKAIPGRVVQPAGSMISFVTDDVDKWYERLDAAGVPTRGKPEILAAFNIYAFFAEDPSGYIVEFQKFLDPAWPAQ